MLKELDPVCSSFVHRAGLGGLAGDAGPCAGKLHDPGRYHRSALRNAGYPAPGWYGWAYLTFGNDGTVLAARLVDLNNGYKDHPSHVKADGSGNFAGDEILTYTIDGVGSFQMNGHFVAMAGTTPYTGGFSETGKVVSGTDSLAGMTGNISIHGTAVVGPTEPTVDNPWLWIAQMTGSVCMAR